VIAHGLLADEQSRGDLAIVQALGDLGENVLLALRELPIFRSRQDRDAPAWRCPARAA
jgi:hypothetical protein